MRRNTLIEQGPTVGILKRDEWQYLRDFDFRKHHKIIAQFLGDLEANGNAGLPFPELQGNVLVWRVVQHINTVLKGSGFRMYQVPGTRVQLGQRSPIRYRILRVVEEKA